MKKTKLNYPYLAHLLASFLFVCSPVLFFTACSDDDDVPISEENLIPDRGPMISDEKIDKPAVVLGEIPSDMKEALNTRLTHLQNAVDEETDVLFVSLSLIHI